MPETVQVLSIHDAKEMQLAIDLEDILRVLTGYLARWTWCITSLDCQGGECDAVCETLCKRALMGDHHDRHAQ